jgi:tetratricopeptide (TPR) repeat protein
MAGILPFAAFLASSMPSQAAAYQRWAVIAAGAGDEAALCELATAELSEVDGIGLVERDEIRKVVDEQVLSSALSAEGTASRLRLGEMLHADALLMVKLQGKDDARILRVTVVDCRYGARLRVEHLPWERQKLAAYADHLRDLAVTVRAQFAQGVVKILGVPSFVSHSFTHEYDPLQSRYSELLQHVLMQEAGVAVIETAEAQAIGREMGIAGERNLTRVVPLMVQGEFRVEAAPNAQPRVTLSVTISDRERVIDRADSGPLDLDKAPAWLTTVVPAKVTAGEARAKPLSPAEQAVALAARGNAFAVLGGYDESIPLRESALLLEPDLTKTRVALLDEYYRRAIGKLGAARHAMDAVSGYERALEHAEWLIRNREQSPCDVYGVLNAVEWYTIGIRAGRWQDQLTPEGAAGIEPLIDRAEQDRRRFVRAVTMALMHKIDPHNAPQTSLALSCHGLVLHLARLNLDGAALNYTTRASLQFQREIAGLMPDDFLPCPLPNLYSGKSGSFNAEVTEPYYQAFLRDLRQSPHRLLQLDAGFILLNQRLAQATADRKFDALPGIETEFTQLITQLNAIPNPYSRNDRAALYYAGLKDAIAQAIAKYRQAEIPNPTGALHFEPCAFKVVAGKTTKEPVPPQFYWASLGPNHWLPCGNFDLLWTTFSRIYVHRTPGVLETVMLPQPGENLRLHDVIWDGRSIWTATSANEIMLLSPDGAVLQRVGKAHGLPPFDGALKMYPDAAGRVIAVGAFGADQRAWCAQIAWDGRQAPAVRVFHQATEVMTANDNAKTFAFNPRAAFTPLDIVTVPAAASGGAPMIAITRQCVALTQGRLLVTLAPLTINLKTLEVGVWHVRRDQQDSAAPVPVLATPRGLILLNNAASRNVVVETYDGAPVCRPMTVSNPGKVIPDNWEANSLGKVTSVVLPHSPTVTFQPYTDGFIYVTGPRWWRIDPKTLTAQRLHSGQLPQPYGFMRYASSALLGLVGWDADKGQCYRITIDDTKIPGKGE